MTANRFRQLLDSLPIPILQAPMVGASLDAGDPLPVKRHGRRAVSVFQRGFRLLQSLLACLAGRPQERPFQDAIAELGPVK